MHLISGEIVTILLKIGVRKSLLSSLLLNCVTQAVAQREGHGRKENRNERDEGKASKILGILFSYVAKWGFLLAIFLQYHKYKVYVGTYIYLSQ